MGKIVKLIKIPKIYDDCLLGFMQYPDTIPFLIKRVYFILNAKTELDRGRHAHKRTQQVLFCIQGSIKMVVDDGKVREEVILNSPEVGILLNEMIWHEMHEFKKNTILLVLASDIFKPEDYIRDHEEFKRLVKGEDAKNRV